MTYRPRNERFPEKVFRQLKHWPPSLGLSLLTACASAPGSPARATEALAAGRYAAAEAALDTLIRAAPDSAALWLRLRGYCRIQRGQARAAVADYDQSLALNPADAITWHDRGMARYELSELAGARRDYGQALKLEPRRAATYLSRGLLSVREQRYRPALDDLRRALALGGTTNASAFNLKGYCELQTGALTAAVASFDRALALDSAYPDARANRAEALRLLAR